MKRCTYITLLTVLVLFPVLSNPAPAQGTDSGIKLWDVATGKQLPAAFKGQGDVSAMALSPDGKTIAAADEFKSINLWDLATKKLIGKLVGHTQFVKEVGFLSNGRMLGSLDAGGNFKLWDTATLQLVRSMSEIGAFASSPDGKTMATSDGSIVKLWDLEKLTVVRQSVGLRRSNSHLVETSFFGTDPARAQFINASTLGLSPGRGLCIGSYIGVSVAFSPDGKVIWASDDCMSEVYLWELKTDKYSRLKGEAMSTFDDGLTIAGTTIELHDKDGKKLRSFTGHVGDINTAQLSPDKKVMASGGSDGYIKLWDVKTGSLIREFLSGQGLVTEVAFSRDGKTLISGGVTDRAAKPTLYVLSVGVDHYRRPSVGFNDLNTGNDVREFSSALEKYGSNAYQRVEVKLLFDQDATRSAIAAAFEDVVAKAKPQDTFVFEFSGQGWTVDEQGLLLPFDYDEKNYVASSVPLSLVQTFLSRIQAEHQLLIIDSGLINKGFDSLIQQFDKENKELAGLVQRDFWMIGPAENGYLVETSVDGKRYGLLTYSLLKGMDGAADVNDDGAITVQELFYYSQFFTYGKNVRHQQKMWNVGKDFILLRTRPDSGGVGIPRSRAPQTETFYPAAFIYSLTNVLGYGNKLPFDNRRPTTPTPTPDSGKTRAELVGAPAGDRSAYVRNGKDYALIIATDNYDHWPHLDNPISDGDTIAAELKDYYGFQIDPQTDILRNPKKEDVYAALRRVKARQYGPDDQLFVLISGHGYYSEARKEGFLIFSNAEALDRSDDLCSSCDTYLSHSVLRNVLNGIDAKHIFLVIDACFGGTFDEKLRGPDTNDPMYENVTNMKMIGRIMQFKTRIFLTSGGKEYVPDGRPGQHSPFARRFIEALRSYGGNFGMLTFYDVLSHVQRVDPLPRKGEWGGNEPGSDFIFELKKKP